MKRFRSGPTIIPASDDQGHSVPVVVRMPSDWCKQMSIIVKDAHFPYTNQSEIVRDALFRHFEWLKEQSPSDGNIFHKLQAMLDLVENAELQRKFQEVLDRLEVTVRYFKTNNASEQAIGHILRILAYVEEMEDGFWRDNYRKLIKDKYGDLLKKAKRINLLNTS